MNLTQSTNDQLMATAAHRYCLGRRSYIVSACIEWIKDTWADFSEGTRDVMIRETGHALEHGEAGDGCDFRMWRAALNWMEGDRENINA